MDDFSHAIFYAALVVAGAGCYAPTPACSEGPEKRELRYGTADLEATPNGGFRIARLGTFSSCEALCASEMGVERVHHCAPPELRPLYKTADAEVDEWVVACDVDAVHCHDPTILAPPSFGSGRRPEGFTPRGRRAGAGGWLAASAALEAASVPAFERLARELRRHGAPRALVRAAHRAQNDETRHARVMGALAARYGVPATIPHVPRLPVRGREELAVENAREGCVGETLAAIVAHFQALHARDPRVRAAMRRIAQDETRHALLSHQVDAWAGSARAAAAKEAALAALEPGDIAAASRDEAAALGLPTRLEAARLIAAARALVWS